MKNSFSHDEKASDIGSRFSEIASLFPNRMAILDGDASVTYVELDKYANRIANALLSQNCAAGTPLPILCVENIKVVAVILGVLKAGYSYCLLNPSFSEGRKSAILNDLNSSIVLTDCGGEEIFGRENLLLDTLSLGFPDTPPGVIVPADALAFVTYTSGSTGEPKGVMRDHQSVLNRVEQAAHIFVSNGEDVFASATASGRGTSNFLFYPLLDGATLAFYPLKQKGIGAFPAWLMERKVSYLQIHSALLRQMLDLLPNNFVFPHLRCVHPQYRLFRRDMERLFSHLPASATVFYSLSSIEGGRPLFFLFHRDDPIEGDIVPIGLPSEGASIRLLNDDGEPVSEGSVGEIELRSHLICRGYWNKPELTARTFLTDPENPSRRIFRTGDLARRLTSGAFVWVGRKDFRAKVRGHTVYLEEVENALEASGLVKSVAVVSREKEDGDSTLTAYVVPCLQETTPFEIRESLKSLLPEHAIPSQWAVLDAIPQLPNGKIDRQTLLSSENHGKPISRSFEPPKGELEEKIAAIWEEVLNIRPIGRNDNFFELGGQSLLAFRLVDRIAAITGTYIPPSSLIEYPTVAAIGARISAGMSSIGRCLFLVSEREGKRKLFLVPPATATALYFRPLAEALGDDFSVYALQSVALDGKSFPHKTIEEMASYYIREMRAAQPEGPYLLGGKCLGYSPALEMAQQLQKQGEKVDILILFDAAGLFIQKKKNKTPAHYWRRRKIYMENGIFTTIMNKLITLVPSSLLLSLLKFKERIIGPGMSGFMVRHFHRQAKRRYIHRSFNGRILLILSEEKAIESSSYNLKWNKPDGGLFISTISRATHKNMLSEPFSSAVAEVIRKHLSSLNSSE